ncbi:MAG: electron transfer flavoprotein subunit alpha/FixB family protein, partial [Planctomycetes bacterium]|nr:electron transfer flavoprotein subunit alpha/FixB family protein [Planctomycetota bacterium]
VLAGASVRATELFATLSAIAGWPMAAECVRLEFSTGGAKATRPVLGGRALQAVRSASKPFLATVRPNTFPADPALAVRAGELRPMPSPAPAPGPARVRYTGVERKGSGRPDLAEADVVVAGGRGLKDPKNFRLVEELADALGAAVGASRAIVDAGWRDVSEQVGKSGRTVSPRLYVAAGVSGAVHHTMGMDTSKVVVAIDKDPKAPIFGAADYGIVGDALAVLPALTRAVKEGAGS